MTFIKRKGRATFSVGKRGPRASYRMGCALPMGLLMLAAGLIACASSAPEPTPRRTPRPTPEPVTEQLVAVRYKLDGSATGADLTYTDGSGNIQQQTGVAVPLRPAGGDGEGLAFRAASGDFVQFSAQNTGSSGNLECTIEAVYVAGEDVRTEILNEGFASGGYAIVSCSATLP